MNTRQSLFLLVQEKAQAFLARHPFVANKRYHLFGLAVAFWPMILVLIAIKEECYKDNVFGCSLFLNIISVLGIPCFFLEGIIFPFFMIFFSEKIVDAMILIFNPLTHYVAGMWLGHLLRKTSRNIQKRVLQFFFLTPILILFLSWRYG